MAGYIFNLKDEESLYQCMTQGVYGTIMTLPKNMLWRIHHEGTFADYASMKEGDLIFFFIQRKIYGIGKLKNIPIGNTNNHDCKFLNFINSDIPTNYTLGTFLDKTSINQRFICIFEPFPSFFEKGIDMDDALSSNPDCFKMLRAFWKVSFIKLDNDESECLFNVLLKKTYSTNIIRTTHTANHLNISNRLTQDHVLTAKNFLKYAADRNKLVHEMALEAGLIYQLSTMDPHTINVFEKWDYISHQVIASPFKPIDYMDKIDIFAYSYIPGFKTKNKFAIIELKKDIATQDDVDQLMKYVDWIKDEYAGQDYTSINAYLVAYDFEPTIKAYASQYAKRYYSIGRRPVNTGIWNNISFIKYRHNHRKNILKFIKI